MISVESQPLFGPTQHWRVFDAAAGKLAEGHTKIADYKDHQPWPVGEVAERLSGGGPARSGA